MLSKTLSPTASIATRVPVELLLIIFHFVGPSTPRNPYPYLPLSWVCRLWRTVVRDEPRFWTVRVMKESDYDYAYNRRLYVYMNPLAFTEGTIWHPNSRAIDFFMHLVEEDARFYYAHRSWYTRHELHNAFFDETCRNQIRTILLPSEGIIDIPVRSHFSFPKLERLSATENRFSANREQLISLIVASPNLRYVELPWHALFVLHSPSLSRNLLGIEWLKLENVPSRLPTILHEVLENMPKLQILILTVRTQASTVDETTQVINLPRLRILSLHSTGDKIWTFQVPKLDYLSVLDFGFHQRAANNDWSLLESFDFSQISNILVGLHAYMSEDDVDHSDLMKRHLACISASNHPLLDCLSFQHFHEEGLNSLSLWNDYLDLPAKNSFHISIPWTGPIQCFAFPIFKRVTNLVELTLHYGAIKDDVPYCSFLEKVLNSVEKNITSLNIMEGRSFTAACNLLGGRRAPRLERLMYHNAFMIKSTAFLPQRLKTLQTSRLEVCSQPLKILELRNFANVPPERVQAMEDLGVQFIQTSL